MSSPQLGDALIKIHNREQEKEAAKKIEEEKLKHL
jgi:hypothetical protein